MNLKRNINSPTVWKEAIFKFLICWIVGFCMLQILYHTTSWYDSSPMTQFFVSLGIGSGNFLVTFFESQT